MMAVDRGLAVFRLYEYKIFKSKIHKSAMVFLAVVAVETIASSLFYPRHVYARMFFLGAGFCAGLFISCIYLLIVCKLYREHRRMDASIATYNARTRPAVAPWTTHESRSNRMQWFVNSYF